jgi:hypothetical protein
MPGVSAPFDNVFDPAGFSATASIRDIRRWRESELTHGRVAMLAALGFVVGEQLEDFPAFYNFDGRIQGEERPPPSRACRCARAWRLTRARNPHTPAPRALAARSPPRPCPRRAGPAINHFQQVGQGFWEPLVLVIGIAESYRVSLGWATPTGNGFNSLKDEYEPGTLG